MIRKALPFLVLMLASVFAAGAQDDALLRQLQAEDRPDTALLPSRIMLTQRMLWGEKGLLRKWNIAPLNLEQRNKEMKTRRFMLRAHQILGFVTLGGMVAQGVVGSQLYNGKFDLKDAHESLATGINVTYSMAALTSLFAPPPLLARDKNLSSVKLHRWLAVVHLTGMVATNILANRIEDNPSLKPYHRAAAYTTFASFAAAMVVITF